MKITIDTKEDSHSEIKKVISLLTHLIGETPASNHNIFDDSKPTEESGNLFNIFDTPASAETKPESKEKPVIQFYWKMEKEEKTAKEIKRIQSKIDALNKKLFQKGLGHLRMNETINAFMASLILGLTFVFKGSLIDISLTLSNIHLTWIIALTSILLTFEIYYVAYSRVGRKERKTRKFGQFWAKRFFTLYGIAFLVSLLLVYLFNMDSLAGSFYGVLNIVVAVSMPCALGAAIPSLIKQN